MATPLKQMYLLPSRNHCLPMNSYEKVGPYNSLSTLRLNIHRPNHINHCICEFLGAVATSCPEDSIPPHPAHKFFLSLFYSVSWESIDVSGMFEHLAVTYSEHINNPQVSTITVTHCKTKFLWPKLSAVKIYKDKHHYLDGSFIGTSYSLLAKQTTDQSSYIFILESMSSLGMCFWQGLLY